MANSTPNAAAASLTSATRRTRLLFAALLTLLIGGLGACGDDGEPPAPASTSSGSGDCTGRCVQVGPGDNDRETLQRVLIDARPGDTILLRAGTYHVDDQISLDVDNVTIRGEGMDKTILSFATQTTGAEGVFVNANDFTIEDLALEDSPGDLLKILGGTNITIRRVRAEWTRGADTRNGAYGFYPIECTNVLIEDSEVRGASDAGVYVGQCHKIIVRGNYVHENVAGVEIENSTDADVYENLTTRNTGGILVFNLPGLPFIDGRRTRVFNNMIVENNTRNFAPAGTTVAAVPKGTGLMILANDEVEIFDNTIKDNGTTGILIISYNTAQIIGGLRGNDPRHDKYSETLFIYDNRYDNNGSDPDASTGDLLEPITQSPLPDIILDGFEDARKHVGGELPDALRTCLQDPTARFFNIDLPTVGAGASSDKTLYDCSFAKLPRIHIAGVSDTAPTPVPFPPAGAPTPTPVTDITESACATSVGNAVNFDVADEPCDFLSSYRFFKNAKLQDPNDGVLPYDLNMQLFSDYTNKHRFVYVPTGKQVQYDASASFDFPVGTVIIKTFAYPLDLRTPGGGERLLETRLLVRREHGWVGLPYVWNEDETEARLRVLGTPLEVTAIQQDGVLATLTYNVPNANQCKECHREQIKVTGPLGPKARHLNKTYAYATGAENQLVHWTNIGILSGAPSDPAAAPRTAVLEDPNSGTVEQRARGYLDVNCSSCHNPQGAARTTGLYLGASETDPLHLGLCKSPVAAGRGTGGFLYDIVPGLPDESILTFRMLSTEPGIAMPEIGRRRAHTEGIDVVRQWITSLDGNCAAP